jgi:hypothetical protein
MMNRHRTGSFLSSIAFISLAIISCMFMFTEAAHAVTETIPYTYDDAGQVVKAAYPDGKSGMASCMAMINQRTGCQA